jgi:L-arabinose isomerase
MTDQDGREIWFVAGSQHLYGEEPLAEVAAHAAQIAHALGEAGLPARIAPRGVVTTDEEIVEACREASRSEQCIGVVFWMHTFSPARMWIAGLKTLTKPWLHLHTQFHRDIPWDAIDMDFMNLNQSAHGGREFGHLATRMRLQRKVVVGHWRDELVHRQLDTWARAACAWSDAQGMRIARLGDNMRNVAVTEGDKVEAQIRLGWSVNGYGLGDLSECLSDVSDSEVSALVGEYEHAYTISEQDRTEKRFALAIRDAARIELGLRAFLEDGRFKAFTTTFENLHGLSQLPGLAVQRLMADGFGFGAEGDWKTAGLVRALKIMAQGLPGGTSFMEDYTYHMHPDGMRVLGAHMLEVCPSLASGRPSLEVHPLEIGGRSDPARLVFGTAAASAVNASLIDLGDRLRMIVNPVRVVAPPAPLSELPVARALWAPIPDLATAATAWILSGGAHHTAFSTAVEAQHIVDLCDIARIECILIDGETSIPELRKELRWNEAYHRLCSR